MGRLAATARPLVPRTEAPIGDLRSAKGWRIVASLYLDHDEEEVLMRLRFFGPDDRLRTTDEALPYLEKVQLGNLFGGADEIFGLTTNEEHTYNAQTAIWFLPSSGPPRVLLSFSGTMQQFTTLKSGKSAGVVIAHQTYDGVDSRTKGSKLEFYAWEEQTKSLSLSQIPM